MKIFMRTICTTTVALLAMSGFLLAGETDSNWLVAASDSTAAKAEVASQPVPPQATVQESPAEEAAGWPPGLLMDVFGYVGVKKPMDDLGIRAWGFAQGGFMGNLTNSSDQLFGRVFDARRVNNARLHQLRLTVDRPYDTAKNFDLGFRIDGLYGGDALSTKSPGLMEGCGSGSGDNYADLLQAYAQGWFKTGESSGLEVTVGKWATTIGYEVIDGVGNPLYSHSYLFGYAIPFTHTGIKLNYVWNSQFSTYFAIVNGWEVFEDNNHAHSYMGGLAWSGAEQIDWHSRDLAYFNVITGPEQEDETDNYRTVLDATYIHWWTEKFSQAINADYGFEQNVPGIGDTRWYGVAHYLTYVFNDYCSATWRSEWFRDEDGSRIGVGGNFLGNTVGLSITPFPKDKVLKNLTVRPELRWDHSDEDVFDGDRDQLTAGFDVIFKF